MKNTKLYLKFIGGFIALLFPIIVFAASSTISVSSSSKTVVVGNTFTVYVTTYSSTALGTFEYTLNYNSGVVKLMSASSGDCNPAYCVWLTNSSSGSKSITYSFKFKAVGTGSSSISVKSARVVTIGGSNTSFTTYPVTVKVITQAQLEASYSKDNTLKSLSVTGYSLTPNFDKNTTSYKLDLDSNVESIKVNATKNDSEATVTGAGTKKVSEGENIIKVIVTAENGSKKTYTITATVKELNPINIQIDGLDYLVIKKASLLEGPDNYQETTYKIGETNVPAFFSEINNYTLIGVKNADGNISLATVNEDGSYSIYKEFKFDGLTFQILNPDEKSIPNGYVLSSTTINDEEVKCYKYEDGSGFVLLYGMNVNTSKTGFYKYDSEENTVQRFNDKDFKAEISKLKNDYKLTVVTLGSSIILILLIFIISSICNKKKHRKIDVENKKIRKKHKKKIEIKEEDML